MTAVTFNDEQYTLGKLDGMTNAELAALFNAARMIMPERVRPNELIRFSDHSAAVRRTFKLLTEAAGTKAEPVPEETKKKSAKPPKPRPEPKRRGMRFVFPLGDEIRDCKVTSHKTTGSDKTLRARCRDLLDEGATFEQVKELVVSYDKDRGKPGRPERLEHRAYELVRLMHYYLGYGLAHDQTTGIIKLVHPKKAA